MGTSELSFPSLFAKVSLRMGEAGRGAELGRAEKKEKFPDKVGGKPSKPRGLH